MLFLIIKGLSDLEDKNIIYDGCIILIKDKLQHLLVIMDSFMQTIINNNGWVVTFCLLANYNNPVVFSIKEEFHLPKMKK